MKSNNKTTENKKKFTVKFYGIRGSYPVSDKNMLEYGGNTSCVEITINNNKIILDAGTGIIRLGDDLMEKFISSGTSYYDRKPMNITLLCSHIHQDHIQGLPFFKPIHVATSNINIFGQSDNMNGSFSKDVEYLLFGKSFPLDISDVSANLNIKDIRDNQVILISPNSETPILKNITTENDLIPEGEDIVISFYKTYSHPQHGNLIYKISYKDKSVVYATDKESYAGGDKKLALFARDTDLLIHDSQYTTEDYLAIDSSKQGFGHSTFEMAFEMQKLSHAKKLAFFHLDPTYNDKVVKQIEHHYNSISSHCFVAKEGMEINIL